MLPDIEPFDYEPSCDHSDWHAVFTVQLGELMEDGIVDFSDASWDFDAYDAEQRDRIYSKLTERHRYSEISMIPMLRWKQGVLARLNEIMPKYKPLYQALKDGTSVLSVGDEYRKERTIYQDFPQTALAPTNQDYARDGRDTEWEHVRDGDFIEKASQIEDIYNDVDVMILKELDKFFMPLFTANVNGF